MEHKYRVWCVHPESDCEWFVYFKAIEGLKLEEFDPLVNIGDIEQYTGLKDKNGKEIYGGDIISYVDTVRNEGQFFKEVIFEDGCFLVRESDVCDMYLGGIASDENHKGSHVCYLAGNIHESKP